MSLHPPPRPLWKDALLAFAAFVVMLVAYAPVWGVMPAGDDFGAPLTDITVGNDKGVWTLVSETRQAKNYRPGQSLLMWLAGRAAGITDPATPLLGGRLWAAIVTLNLMSAAVVLAVTTLALRLMPLGTAGVAAGLLVVALHPSMVAGVASIDGFSAVLTPAFVWLGALGVVALRERPALGLLAAAGCLLAGATLKEYAFGLASTAALAALCFVTRKRFLWAAVHLVVLGTVVAALLWMRRYVVPEGVTAREPPAPASASHVVFNFALIAAGASIVGNTMWLYLSRSAVAWVTISTLIASAVGWVGKGVAIRLRDTAGPATQVWPWVVLLAGSLFTTTFPANTVMRISEMYLVSVVMAVALLTALATDGYARFATRRSGRLAAGVAVVLLGVAGVSTWQKTAAVGESGRRAAHQGRLAASHIPDGVRDAEVFLVFRRDTPLVPTYSVFAVGDGVPSEGLFNVYLPTRGLVAKSHVVDDEAGVSALTSTAPASEAPVVLVWQPGNAGKPGAGTFYRVR